jgi:D-alanyl-D-alanine carboxypeptidase/D-alanyl-D-alanine-endopeptidase (penicillin-binding protein 4)
MGGLRSQHSRAARTTVVLALAATLASACAASAESTLSAALRAATAPPVPTATAPPPTSTPTPTATPTPLPTPTPTALPTPTPTVEPVIATNLLRSSIEASFEELDELGVQYGFAAFVKDFGYIEERAVHLELLPASNQKLVTAVGALELLPEDFRFVTQMRLDVEGNVYLVGGGDPTLTKSHLRVMIADLVGALTAGDDEAALVVNDVVVDPTYFSDTRAGPGWPERYIPVDVGPMSGLMIDNNQHRGDKAYVADPDFGNAELVRRLVAEADIEVAGKTRVGLVDADAVVVAQRTSPSLISMVDTILGRSDNEIAEALVRQIGLQYEGESEIPAGQAVLFERIADLGLDLGSPDGDGSGLSRLNRRSAFQLVELLRLASEQPWWSVIDNGMADAGVDGTLAARLETDTTTGNVRAKTGTLDGVTALSGVLTTIDDAEVFFSFMVNGEAAKEAVDSMDQIIIALASATVAQLTD